MPTPRLREVVTRLDEVNSRSSFIGKHINVLAFLLSFGTVVLGGALSYTKTIYDMKLELRDVVKEVQKDTKENYVTKENFEWLSKTVSRIEQKIDSLDKKIDQKVSLEDRLDMFQKIASRK